MDFHPKVVGSNLDLVFHIDLMGFGYIFLTPNVSFCNGKFVATNRKKSKPLISTFGDGGHNLREWRTNVCNGVHTNLRGREY